MDFSEYTGPSEEWIAVERELPTSAPNLSPKELKAVETAPLMCAGLTIWNALETGGIDLSGGKNSDKTLAIIGAGGGLGEARHSGPGRPARLPGCWQEP